MSGPCAAGTACRTSAKIAVKATAAPATRANRRGGKRGRWLSFEEDGNGVSPVHIINHFTIHPGPGPSSCHGLVVFHFVEGRVGLSSVQTALSGDESEK